VTERDGKRTMQQPIKILAVLKTREANEAVSAVAARAVQAQIDVRIGEVRELAPRLVNGSVPDVLLADVSLDDTTDLEALGRFAQAHAASTAVIATSSAATLDGMRRLMRFGIQDFLPQPIVEADLMSALEAALHRRQQVAPAPAKQSGRIVAILGSSGGIGATTIATQTALALSQTAAKRQQRVALLDLDFQNGSCALALDLDPGATIEAVLQSPDRLDGAFLESSMVRHPGGLELLGAARDGVAFESMTPEIAENILRCAAHDRNYVLVELPATECRWTQAVLAASDLVILVTQLTVPALRQARRKIDMLAGATSADLAVLANRIERRWWRNRVRLRDAEQALGRGIDFTVANDYQIVSEALNTGKPLAEIKRGARVSRDIVELANKLQERLKREPAMEAARPR
jgi:pilus assembly protein CpaE